MDGDPMSALVRQQLHREYCPPLEADQEWWTDTPHALAARVRLERRRGRVIEVTRVELAPGMHGSIVQRIKSRPAAWRMPVLVATGLGFMTTAVVVLAVRLLASALQVIPYVLGFALIFASFRVVMGHQPTCAGLHCPGCRH
jgi:hypothetical protein